MSHLDFETVSFVDEYVAMKAKRKAHRTGRGGSYDYEYDDDEARADSEQALKSLRRRAELSRPESITRTEVFLSFETSESNKSQIAAAVVSSNVVVCVTTGLVMHVTDQLGTVPNQRIDLNDVIAAGGAGGRSKKKAPKSKASAGGAVGSSLSDRVGKLLIDPTGRHIFVSLENRPLLVYVMLKAGQAKPAYSGVIDLPDAAGYRGRVTVGDDNHLVSVWSIAFNSLNKFATTTGELLLGTRQGGQLWAARFEANGANAVKRVYIIAGEKNPIVGLTVLRDRVAANDRQRAIVACTPFRLYGFVGYGSLESILASFAVDRIPSPGAGAVLDARRSREDAAGADINDALVAPLIVELAPGGGDGAAAASSSMLGNVAQHTTFAPVRYPTACFLDSFVVAHAGGVAYGSLIDITAQDQREALAEGQPLLHVHSAANQEQVDAYISTSVAGPSAQDAASPMPSLNVASPRIGGAKAGRGGEGAASPPGTSNTVPSCRVLGMAASQYWTFIVTEEAVTAVLHPACVPWVPARFGQQFSRDGASTNASPLRGPGGGATGGLLGVASSFGLRNLGALAGGAGGSGTGLSNPSFADDAASEVSFARGGQTNAAASPNIAMTTCSSESGAPQGGVAGAGNGGGADIDEALSRIDFTLLAPAAHAVTAKDLANRTIARFVLSAESRDLVSRNRATAGAMVDTTTGKAYMFTPHHVYELNLPKIRPAMIPLFLDAAKNAERTYRRTASAADIALAAARPMLATAAFANASAGGTAALRGIERSKAVAEAVVARLQRAADIAVKQARVIAVRSPLDTAQITLGLAKQAFQGKRYIEAATMFAECDVVPATSVILLFTGVMHAGDPEIVVGLESYVSRRIRRWVTQRQSWMDLSAQIFCLSHFLVLLLVGRCNSLSSLKKTALIMSSRGNAAQVAEEERAAKRRARAIFGAAFGGASLAAADAQQRDMDNDLLPDTSRPADDDLASPARGGATDAAGQPDRTVDLAHLSQAAAAASDFSSDVARAAVREINANLRRSISSAVSGSDQARGSQTIDASIEKSIDIAEASIAASLLELGDTLEFGLIQDRLLSTANPALLAVVCTLLHRFDDVMRYLVLLRDFRSAVRLLIKYCLEPMFAPLWRRHMPALMPHFPVTLVRRGLIPHGSAIGLRPFDFSSAFASYSPTDHNERVLADDDSDVSLHLTSSAADEPSMPRIQGNVVVEYFSHLVHVENRQERNLCDWLLVMLAKNAATVAKELVQKTRTADDAATAEQLLLKYVASDNPSFGVTFALRECQRVGQWRACVRLHALLAQYTEAVKLALRVGDLTLAKATVNGITRDDSALKTDLWRLIARHVVRQQGGPKNALLLLRETKLLNMNDVLPHFADDVMLADFKDELVASVNQFDRFMKGTARDVSLRQELAANINGDIAREKNRSVLMQETTKCQVCKQPALSRDYVYFGGCGHGFHVQCFNEAAERDYCGEAAAECFLCATTTLRANLVAPIGNVKGALKLTQ